VIIVGLLQVQLGEDAAYMLFDGSFGDPQPPSYSRIGAAFGHLSQHLSLPQAEHSQRVVSVAGGDQLGDECRVDRRPALGDPLQRFDELLHVGDAALEEITNTLATGQQLHGVVHLDVRRQDQDADPGMLLADLPGSLETFRGMCRGHPDVDHHKHRRFLADQRSSWAPSPARPTISNPERSSRLAMPSRSRTSSSARTTRKPVMSRRSPFPPRAGCAIIRHRRGRDYRHEHTAPELAVRGGLTARMVVASGLLALVIAAAFAVLLSSVADLRTTERRARQSEEVLVVANRLERLVVDLETGQRGFVITGQERFLQPWRDAQVAFPGEAGTLEQLVADNPEQQARARRITQAISSYLSYYSIPLVATARRPWFANRLRRDPDWRVKLLRLRGGTYTFARQRQQPLGQGAVIVVLDLVLGRLPADQSDDLMMKIGCGSSPTSSM
jgi:CHASE3 domain